MRPLTQVEVDFVSGGRDNGSKTPPGSPKPDNPGDSPGDKILDEVLAGIARIREAISNIADAVGDGIRDVLSDGPSHTEVGPNGYQSTKCAPGQDMPKPGTCVTPAPKEEKKGG
jgi:hypothetical protein